MYRGFAKLYRKLKEWEWYKDGPVKELYIHFLLSANHKDGFYKGIPVARGSMISGRKALSSQTSLTEQQVRRAINALEKTGYIRCKTASKSTMFSVIDFDTYNDNNQRDNQQTTRETTNKQPSDNQVTTTNKNEKNPKNGKNEKKYNPRNAASHISEIDHGIWKEWIDHKVKMKASIGERAINKNIKQLREIGLSQANLILEQSIDNGWKGLFPYKGSSAGVQSDFEMLGPRK